MSTKRGDYILTDTKKLLDIIEQSGLKKSFIASKLSLSTYGFQRKVENKSQFRAEEIAVLCKLLNITSLKEKEKIFFANM